MATKTTQKRSASANVGDIAVKYRYLDNEKSKVRILCKCVSIISNQRKAWIRFNDDPAKQIIIEIGKFGTLFRTTNIKSLQLEREVSRGKDLKI